MKKTLLSLFCLIAFINLDAQTLVNIGNGSSYTANYESSPINTYYRSHHCQILYTPSEINAAGYAGSGLITKLGFNIFGTTTYGLPNFTIKLKNTLVNDLTVYDTTGITTVYTSPSYSPTAGGFDLLMLTNSFTWDGVSNLLVDVCFDQVPAWTATGQVYTFGYSSGGSQYQYISADIASQCGISTVNANTSFKPQIQIEFPSLPLCVGTPTPGYAAASSNLVCPNTPFQLDYLGGDFASGLLYQWQSSPNGSTWSNLGSASSSKHYNVSNITDTTYFRCIITCTASVLSNTCTSTIVNLNPLNNCYCIPSYALICTNDKIIDFSIANVVNQQSNCDLNGYSDSTSSAYTAINLNAGITYSLQANIANSTSGGNMAAGAWIDFNQNGVFETSEFTSLGFGGAQICTSQIAVPINIASGTVRMRIKVDANYAGPYTILDPCNNNNFASYGQILDYRVNLIAAPACSGSPTVATAISSQSAVCSNVSYTLDLTNNSISSGIVYQWQSSLDGITWTPLGAVQSTIPFSVSTQSVTTYYRCISTCTNSSISSTSTPVTVLQNLPTACYCTPQNLNCSSLALTSLTLETLTNTPVCNGNGAYTNNDTLTTIPLLNANQSYSISIGINSQAGTAYTGIWMDYNQDGFFTSNEYTDAGSIYSGTLTPIINVPFTAVGGNTRMRVKVEANNASVPILDPCATTNYWGQTIDYIVNITPLAPCAATLTAGNTLSSDSTVCTNTSFTLNLVNNSIASNITYKWQYSSDNVTWNDLTTTVQSYMPFVISNQTTATYYRCITTCSASAQTSTSTPVLISQNTISDCYCIPPASDCSLNDQIKYVLLATISNTSACSAILNGDTHDGYSDYTGSVASASLNAGQTYPISVSVGQDINEYVSAWIDYNQDGVFDASEFTNLGVPIGNGNDTVQSFITIPNSATLGTTRMRLRNNRGMGLLDSNACYAGGMPMRLSSNGTGSNYGETEDYKITILQQNCSTINFPPSISAVGTNTICYAESDTLDLSFSFPPVSGITYQWKSSTGGPYVNLGSAISTSSLIVTPTVTTSYYCEIMCNSNIMLSSDTATITIRPSTNISGTVTVFPNTSTPVAGRVILYRYKPYYTQFDSVAGQNIGAAGDYNFTSFNSGVYIVKAIPNLTSLQIAYGDSAINWKTAKQIIHGCTVNDVQNIQVKALPSATATPGPGRLTGIITQTVGFGHRPIVGPSNSNTNLFKPMVPGEPIGGIVVKGGRNPGGQMYTQTISGTDTTSPAWGTYTLTGLPLGDYFVLVDITKQESRILLSYV